MGRFFFLEKGKMQNFTCFIQMIEFDHRRVQNIDRLNQKPEKQLVILKRTVGKQFWFLSKTFIVQCVCLLGSYKTDWPSP